MTLKKLTGIMDGIYAVLFSVLTVFVAFANHWGGVLVFGALAISFWRLWERRHWLSLQDWLKTQKEVVDIINSENPKEETDSN